MAEQAGIQALPFGVGQKVREPCDAEYYTVQAIALAPVLTLKGRDGHTFQALASDYEEAPLPSPDEAWLEVTVHIGVYLHQYGLIFTAGEIGNRKLRHECYCLLGRSMKVTPAVKERLRALIGRTLEVYRWL